MEQRALSFCKFIKHNESLLEAILDNSVDFGVDHANEVNNILKSMSTVPYGILVDVRNDFTFNFDAGVKIGNLEFEKRVAFLIHRKSAETAARCVIHMQKASFPEKELKIFYDRDLAIKWLEEI